MSALLDPTQADAFTAPIPIPAGRPVPLRVEIDYERLHFACRVAELGGDWRWLPEVFDASLLSGEATVPGQPNLTGSFLGLACQDLAGTARAADFGFFESRERSDRAKPFGP
jgi:xylan 1,4-beta-xylosidase